MSDVKDQGLTVWQKQFPALRLPQRQLAKQLGRMQYIATVAKAAMDELSDTYAYNEFKMHTTMAVTAQLRKHIAAGNISPEEEAAYQHDAEEFLKRMLEVGQVAGCQILEEQHRAPETMGNGSLIDDVRSFLLSG